MVPVTSVAYVGVLLLIVAFFVILRATTVDALARAAWFGGLGLAMISLAFARAWGREPGQALATVVIMIAVGWTVVFLRAAPLEPANEEEVEP